MYLNCVHLSSTVFNSVIMLIQCETLKWDMKMDTGLTQSFAMNKPVYIKTSKIQMDKNQKLAILKCMNLYIKKVEDEVFFCIQFERDLRIDYLKSKKSLFIVEVFEIRNITAQVYGSNPFSIGATGPRDNVLNLSVVSLCL